MFVIYDDVKINYEILGSGDNVIVFLHGWGGSIESFRCIAKDLKLNSRCLLIDFAPFGNSSEPKQVWGVKEYADSLNEVLKAEKIEKFSIISHSFGGRVAIYFASQQKDRIKKLVLVDSAGIKAKKGIKKRLRILFFKFCRRFKIKNNFKGSKDYQVLNSNMKKIFVKVINEDLSAYCKIIDAKTLIIFGKQDKDTPIYMAKRLHKLIKNSKLKIIDGGHFAYLENYPEFKAIVENFIGG